MATVDPVASGTLGEINIGLAAAIGFINPLGAQIDALVGLGLSPLQVDLAAQFNAALAAQATLTLQVTDPLAAIKAALAAVIQLQAALTAALALPPLHLSLSAELSASAALSAALSAKIGGLRLLINAALNIKIPAIRAAAQIAADLSAGPAIVLVFDGISDATPLSVIGSLIQAKFAAGVTHGANTIFPTDPTSGILIITKGASVFASLQAIIQT